MKIEHILFVSAKNELPYYLEDYKDITDIYIMNLNDKPETIVDDYFRFVCKSKTRYFIIAETECAFYARMITGWFRLLINPILIPKIEQENIYNHYMDWIYGDQNMFECLAWFTNINDVNIEQYKEDYRETRCILDEYIDLKNDKFLSIINDKTKYYFMD